MKQRYLTTILLILAALAAGECFAQSMPERSLVRKGNRQYERGNYDTSVDNYARALQADPGNFEAKFNTANVQFRKELIDKSEQTLRKLAQDSTRTDIERSEIAYNLGNTLFVQQKLEEALDCYRTAMRFNPDDQQAKFNYALTKELLKQQQNQQQQQQQNQNQDQNQDQQDQEQQQNKEDKEQDKEDNKDQEQQQPQPEISEQEQQAMLEAIQAQEDKTQEKLKEKKGVIIRGGKNW